MRTFNFPKHNQTELNLYKELERHGYSFHYRGSDNSLLYLGTSADEFFKYRKKHRSTGTVTVNDYEKEVYDFALTADDYNGKNHGWGMRRFDL